MIEAIKIYILQAGFEVYTALMSRIMVSWAVTLGGSADCRRFERTTAFIVNSPDATTLLLSGSTQNIRTHSTSSYTGCNRRNGPDFGRVFLMLNYTEKPQNTYIQS